MTTLLQILLVASAGLLSVSLAAPVPTNIAMGNAGAVYMAIVVFAGIGAVLGACVCCRRRKQGFEPNQVKDRKEFENESGVADANRTTEFPIFRALSSPQTVRSTAPLAAAATAAGATGSAASSAGSPQQPANAAAAIPVIAAAGGGAFDGGQPMLATPALQAQVQAVPAQLALAEGLIVPIARQQQQQLQHEQLNANDDLEMDNNNGPISPADLQNIANNNALEFIPNLNEVAAAEAAAAAAAAAAAIIPPPVVVNMLPLQACAPAGSQSPHAHYRRSSYENNPFLEAADEALSGTAGGANSQLRLADIRIDIDDGESSTEAPLLQRNSPPMLHHHHQQQQQQQMHPSVSSNATVATRLQNVVVGGAGGRNTSGYQMLCSHADGPDDAPLGLETDSVESAVPMAASHPVATSVVQTESGSGSETSVAEVNSVEEALRALDFAISGEDSLQMYDDEDDEDDDDEDADADDHDERADEAPIFVTEEPSHELQADACFEAEQLVDDVLHRAAQRAAEQQRLEASSRGSSAIAATGPNHSEPARAFDASGSSNATVVEATFGGDRSQTPQLPADESGQPEEPATPHAANKSLDGEAFDFGALALEASTPFVSKQQFGGDGGEGGACRKVSNKLFGNAFGSTESLTPAADATFDDPKPLTADDETFTAPAAAGDQTVTVANGTFTAAADGTFVCDKSIAAADATFEADRTYMGVPKPAKSGRITVTIPPEIKIITSADAGNNSEATSVDLTTATPVNTPIELNYSLDSWDRFISNSMQQKPPPQLTVDGSGGGGDSQQPCTSRQALEADAKAAAALAAHQAPSGAANETFEMNSSGWFVPSAGPSANSGAGDATFVQNATMTLREADGKAVADDADDHEAADDEDDDDENQEDGALLSLTFDALRKQLAEALPHAQGSSIAGPADISDDEDDNASGAVGGVVGTDSDFDFEPQQSTAQAEMHINYNFANFKRALSPIAEESEDELSTTNTCKTFVLNETTNTHTNTTGKGADNNSSCSFVGGFEDGEGEEDCGETGEAIILGVTKTLMASNDTLFNFEDTLGDRDDPFSPRTPSSSAATPGALAATNYSDMSRSTSNNSSVYDCRTPTAPLDSGPERNFHPLDFGSGVGSQPSATLTPVSPTAAAAAIGGGDFDGTSNAADIDDIFVPEWDAAFANAAAVAMAAADLLSPDQQKTFSEDMCCTTIIEHGGGGGTSSDLSLTIDATFSGTDDRTCITAAVGGSAASGQGGTGTAATTATVGSPSTEEGFGDVEEGGMSGAEAEEGGDDGGSAAGDVTTPVRGDFFEQSASDVVRCASHASGELHLSGEEDPWAHPIGDIRFNATDDGQMRTSFSSSPPAYGDHQNDQQHHQVPTNSSTTTVLHSTEWDSDDEDGEEDSSEEFEYVSGAADVGGSRNCGAGAANGSSTAGDDGDDDDDDESGSRRPDSLGVIGEDEVWNAHADKIPVGSATQADRDEAASAASNSGNRDDDDDGEDDDDEGPAEDDSSNASSEPDGEWVPSCWDSMAQPVRSALKSPDKTSSEDDSSGGTTNKKRRSVAFKKQNYHSVYEYPKEVVALSPAYSEPQMGAWERSYAASSSASGAAAPAYNRLFDAPANPGVLPPYSAELSGATTDLAGLVDGFTVSSSQRPFHGPNSQTVSSQFNAQCHTWPTSDADFSWSQIQEDNESQKENLYTNYHPDNPIRWPKGLGDFFCSEQVKEDGGSSTDEAHTLGSAGSGSGGESITRPDSGVGESQADALTDSLGDLCHTKSSLRLPLNCLPPATTAITGTKLSIIPASPAAQSDASFPFNGSALKKNRLADDDEGAEDDDDEDDDEDEDDRAVNAAGVATERQRQRQRAILDALLPTPSCTGSMDSLSSGSSGSERGQVSFTTFGKRHTKSPAASATALTSCGQQQLQPLKSLADSSAAVNHDSDSSSSTGSHSSRPQMIFIESTAQAPLSPAHDSQQQQQQQQHSPSLFRTNNTTTTIVKMAKHVQLPTVPNGCDRQQMAAQESAQKPPKEAALGLLAAAAAAVNGPLLSAASSSQKQANDSTDEDSGIESIMRIAKHEPKHVVN